MNSARNSLMNRLTYNIGLNSVYNSKPENLTKSQIDQKSMIKVNVNGQQPSYRNQPLVASWPLGNKIVAIHLKLAPWASNFVAPRIRLNNLPLKDLIP